MLDSDATSHMVKGESFIAIDKEYKGTITNAKSSKSSIEGRGTIEIKQTTQKVVSMKKGCRMNYLYLVKLKIGLSVET